MKTTKIVGEKTNITECIDVVGINFNYIEFRNSV